jgi:ubiquinol-cytochrome c reductase cytochrome c1 subunit
MAKDICTFLAWDTEPEHDDCKKMGMKIVIILTGLTALSIWLKRFKWAPIKSRKIVYK